ncbi:hypothetical protein KVV02_001328 [Mortierella alpina]|uniref:Blue (type 1) copper domain-containing protein n=1 Tax=Mortierella alpina TaxID=64518 RepID=A0A9P8A4L2_MORAP|nr:hypothetical protein KVV02_001328 [Mortierella alpina]
MHFKITVIPALLALAAPAIAAVYQVRTIGLEFSPSTLAIKAGDTVEWTMPEAIQHDVVQGSNCQYQAGGFKSDLLSNGKKYIHVFKKIGTYPYFCAPHCDRGMKGTITVS